MLTIKPIKNKLHRFISDIFNDYDMYIMLLALQYFELEEEYIVCVNIKKVLEYHYKGFYGLCIEMCGTDIKTSIPLDFSTTQDNIDKFRYFSLKYNKKLLGSEFDMREYETVLLDNTQECISRIQERINN